MVLATAPDSLGLTRLPLWSGGPSPYDVYQVDRVRSQHNVSAVRATPTVHRRRAPSQLLANRPTAAVGAPLVVSSGIARDLQHRGLFAEPRSDWQARLNSTRVTVS